MKLIAIEGPDKVGKHTQTTLLAYALRDRGHSVVEVEIPFDDGATYRQIYAMLADGTAHTYPQAFQALQVANRMIWQSRLLPELDCDVVLLDRWDTSTWVYGRAAGLDDAFIAAVTKDGRPADHTLLLDGALMSAATDTYEADTVFMSRVREEYLRWGKEHGAAVINANQSRVVVTAQLQAHCDTWLAR